MIEFLIFFVQDMPHKFVETPSGDDLKQNYDRRYRPSFTIIAPKPWLSRTPQSIDHDDTLNRNQRSIRVVFTVRPATPSWHPL